MNQTAPMSPSAARCCAAPLEGDAARGRGNPSHGRRWHGLLRGLWRGFCLAGCCLLLPGWACAQQSAPAPAPEALFTAPLADAAGQPATLKRFRGQPLLVNFWARWCGPCQTEIPELVAQYARAKSAGVQIVGVAFDDKPDAVRDFAKAYDMVYPVLLLADKQQAIDLLTPMGNPQIGLPFTLVINRDGKIVRRKLGAMSPAEITSALDAASK